MSPARQNGTSPAPTAGAHCNKRLRRRCLPVRRRHRRPARSGAKRDPRIDRREAPVSAGSACMNRRVLPSPVADVERDRPLPTGLPAPSQRRPWRAGRCPGQHHSPAPRTRRHVLTIAAPWSFRSRSATRPPGIGDHSVRKPACRDGADIGRLVDTVDRTVRPFLRGCGVLPPRPGREDSDPRTDGDDRWLSLVRSDDPCRDASFRCCSGAGDSSPHCTRNRRSVADGSDRHA